MKTFVLVMIIIVLLIAFVIFSPIFTIMSINTLFGTKIDISFATWLSALWLVGCVCGSAAYRRNS